ncbi:MAG: HD domain-containing protein, partial [Coriobacteriia bacterium]|nr:HD domain-containing protein [Coriobacteriia bacterium]
TWLMVGAASGLVYAAVDLVGFVAPRHNRASGSSGAVAFVTLVRLLGGLYLGQISLGLVLATVYSVLGLLALPILVVLMLLMQHSFALLLRIRESYVRTVTALAHLPEMQLNRNCGHSERVSELAVLVGRQVGLSGRKLERLALAALLHDIGRIAVDGFESQQNRDESAFAVSEGGARILEKITFLAEVAPVLRAQAQLPDKDDEDGTMGLIISMCSDWDEFASAGLSLEYALGQMRERWQDETHLRCRSALEQVVHDQERVAWC